MLFVVLCDPNSMPRCWVVHALFKCAFCTLCFDLLRVGQERSATLSELNFRSVYVRLSFGPEHEIHYVVAVSTRRCLVILHDASSSKEVISQVSS